MVQLPTVSAANTRDTFIATPVDDYELIDTEARDYLPHMYGAVNYAVIDEVRKLPLKVSDIYRRLTT
jgi:hypothetical protein